MIRPLRRPRGGGGKIRTGIGEWVSNDYRFVFLRWPDKSKYYWTVIAADDDAEDMLRDWNLRSQKFSRLEEVVQAVQNAIALNERDPDHE